MQINLHKLPFLNEKSIPWVIWSVAGLFYFFEIMLRMLPGTSTSELMHIFKINATELGVFTAFYYWSYTIMQIPAGLIVDRFSIRRTLVGACLLCVLGFMTVHATADLQVAELGRFIIGFGSAFAYVSALKVASVWLPANRFGLASCIVDSLGMIGAMFAEIVFVHINITAGYRVTIHSLIITGLIVCGMVYLVLRDGPERKHKSQKERHYEELKHADQTNVFDKLAIIARNPQIWLIGAVGCLFYLPSSVIGDVWGIPYLKTVYHVTQSQASYLMATFFAGWTIVGPFLGAISDKTERRVLPVKLTLWLDLVLFSLVIFLPPLTGFVMPLALMYGVFFFIGVATGTHPLIFALAKENYSNRIAGTVVAFTNTVIMLGGLLFQPLVGFLLDSSHGSLHQLHAVYTANNFSFALSIIPLSLAACLIIMKFVKETGYQLHKYHKPANADRFSEREKKAVDIRSSK